jgi:hypothetical protein
MIEIPHQGRAGPAIHHLFRGATHIDVNDMRASGLRHARALRHRLRFASSKLNDRAGQPRPFSAQARFLRAFGELIRRDHLAHHQPGTALRRNPPEGVIRHA